VNKTIKKNRRCKKTMTIIEKFIDYFVYSKGRKPETISITEKQRKDLGIDLPYSLSGGVSLISTHKSYEVAKE